MTWLPTGGETGATLGLVPDAYEWLQEMYSVAWEMTDAELLQLCFLRLAQVLGCAPALADADRDLLAELDCWWSSDRFTEPERAVLAYAEQFVLEAAGVTQEQKDEVARHLGAAGLFNFVHALSTIENCMRVRVLLDLRDELPRGTPRSAAQPEPPAKVESPMSGSDVADLWAFRAAVVDPRFLEARATYGRLIVSSRIVDELVSEVVRLRNAAFQQCHY